MNSYDVTIIIINWNTRDILRDCLNSVYEQTHDIDYEVIVVDNASSDGSAEMVKKEFPQVFLLENTENRGFAAANNQGMRVSKGRYVLLLNSDTVILDGAIQKTIVFADLHPESAVIGIRNINANGTIQRNCFQFACVFNLLISTFGLHRLFPNSRLFGRERLLWWDYLSIRDVDVVAGCYMLVRRSAIEQVGMMDESYFMYGEEMDWCWRFKKAGWKNLFYPNAEIIHLGGQSSKQVRIEMIIQLRRAILQFMKKNRGQVQYYLGSLLVVLFFLLRIPYWLAVSLIPEQRQRALDMAKAYWQGSHAVLMGK